jgi:RNA polymerase-binding transcription factor DksA
MKTARVPNLREMSRLELLERRKALILRRETEERAARELYDERESDWEDRAQNVSAAVGLERLGEVDRAQLARIDAALDRLVDGSWGWCVACGRPIEDARLRIVPEADRCSACTNSH